MGLRDGAHRGTDAAGGLTGRVSQVWQRARPSRTGKINRESNREELKMSVYQCDKCGMSIGTMTCGTCDRELEHGSITADSGDEIQVSKCPLATQILAP